MAPRHPGPTVSVVVVNHNSGEALASFVASLPRPDVAEVIVVDNASGDGSVDRVERDVALRVVETGANLGYGAGANRGVALTGAELVLISNPDVIVHPGAFAALVAAMEDDPVLAIAGPTIMGPDGSRYPSPRRFPSFTTAAGHALLGTFHPANRFSRRYRMEDLDLDTAEGTRAVDWVSGACFLARRRALGELGGFDEGYFMYAEDLDLCWRAHRAGWGVAYVPRSVVTHQQGVSTSRRPYRMLLAHHRSALRFAFRRTTGWRRLLLPGVVVILAVRLALSVTRQVMADRHKKGTPAD